MIKRISLACLVMLALQAAAPAIKSVYNWQQQRMEFETVPFVLPATPTDLVSNDVHILELDFENITTSDVTIRVRDKQASPIGIVPDDLVVKAKSKYIMIFSPGTGRLAPGGITISSADGTSITGTAKWF